MPVDFFSHGKIPRRSGYSMKQSPGGATIRCAEVFKMSPRSIDYCTFVESNRNKQYYF